MKLNVTQILTLIALGTAPLAGCNTIKGLISGEKEEAPETEAEPSAAATPSAAPAETAPSQTAAPEVTASAAPSAEPAQISAANEADVKRFDDEQKLDAPADTKIKSKASTIIKEPPSGDVVALLQPGTEVKALASRDGFTLLAFANPTKPEETLMGWTKTDTVEPVAAPAAAPGEPCVPGFGKVFAGTTERCEVICTSNAGCPTGKACSGSGKTSDGGVPGAAVKFCASPAAAAPTTPIRRPRAPDAPKEEKKKKKTKGKKKADE